MMNRLVKLNDESPSIEPTGHMFADVWLLCKSQQSGARVRLEMAFGDGQDWSEIDGGKLDVGVKVWSVAQVHIPLTCRIRLVSETEHTVYYVIENTDKERP